MSAHKNYYKVGPDLDDRNGILDRVIDENGEEFPDMSRRPAPTHATARWSDARTRHGDCLRSWSTGHLIVTEACYLKVSNLVLHPGACVVPTAIMRNGRIQTRCVTYYFPDNKSDIVNITKSRAEWFSDGWPMRFIGTPVVDTREIEAYDIVMANSLRYVVSQTFKDIVEASRFSGLLFEPLDYQPRAKGDPIGFHPGKVKRTKKKGV